MGIRPHRRGNSRATLQRLDLRAKASGFWQDYHPAPSSSRSARKSFREGGLVPPPISACET